MTPWSFSNPLHPDGRIDPEGLRAWVAEITSALQALQRADTDRNSPLTIDWLNGTPLFGMDPTGLGGTPWAESTPPLWTTSKNNYTDEDLATQVQPLVLQITASTAVNLTGIAAPTPTGPDENEVWPVVLWNVGSSTITIKNEASGSTAANRFHLRDGTDQELAEDEWAVCLYDVVAERWRVLNSGAGGATVTGINPDAGPFTGVTITCDQATGIHTTSGPNLAMYAATPSQWGVVTTAPQSLGGNKTFTGNVIINGYLFIDQSGVDLAHNLVQIDAGSEHLLYMIPNSIVFRTGFTGQVYLSLGSTNYSGYISTHDVEALQFHCSNGGMFHGATGVDPVGNVIKGGIITTIGPGPGGPPDPGIGGAAAFAMPFSFDVEWVGDSSVPPGSVTLDTPDLYNLDDYAPDGTNDLTFKCWGGGGIGGSPGMSLGGGGGGGGAYAESTISYTKGSGWTVVVGEGSTVPTLAGSPSSVLNASMVVQVQAYGGGASTDTSGGVGGAAASCTGTIKRSGGDGQDSSIAPLNNGSGGGGGSSAGTGANGNNASGNAGGTAPTGGGAGGSGGAAANPGSNGVQPGGGGGGGGVASTTGNGGNGRIIISWG